MRKPIKFTLILALLIVSLCSSLPNADCTYRAITCRDTTAFSSFDTTDPVTVLPGATSIMVPDNMKIKNGRVLVLAPTECKSDFRILWVNASDVHISLSTAAHHPVPGGTLDEKLFEAVKHPKKYEASIHHLIMAGANVNARPVPGQETILQLAILSNNPNIVELLVRHGADVNAINHQFDGLTPLHTWVYRSLTGDPEEDNKELFQIFDILRKNGADVNRKSKAGDTPLSHGHKILDKFCLQSNYAAFHLLEINGAKL